MSDYGKSQPPPTGPPIPPAPPGPPQPNWQYPPPVQYPPQYPVYQQVPVYYQVVPAGPPSSGAATASLVFGIIGLLISLFPVAGLIGLFPDLLAVALGMGALAGTKNRPIANPGVAKAGIVTGILGAVICIAWLVFFGAIIGATAPPMTY